MTNESSTRAQITGKSAVNTSRQQGLKEEDKYDSLAKEALAETIREGGAFASEKSDQFKQ